MQKRLRGESEVPLQVLNVGRRQLLLVLVTSFTPRQDWLAELPQVSNFHVRCCYESCFSALIYGYWPFSGHDHEKTENDLHSRVVKEDHISVIVDNCI